MTIAHYRKVLKNPAEIKNFSVTAEKYAISICRGFLGVDNREINARALEHGKMYEPFARNKYELSVFCEVPIVEKPIYHSQYSFVCGTPDGLIDDGIVEIKCPENPDNHFLNICEGWQTDDYYAQMQGYMWILKSIDSTKGNWCDFVSYHPHYPQPYDFFCMRLERDNQYIEVLQEKILLFRELVLKAAKSFSEKLYSLMMDVYMPNF